MTQSLATIESRSAESARADRILHRRLLTIDRPALMRALAIAGLDNYPEADEEYALLAAEVALLDLRITLANAERAAGLR